jgi:hypothetical protein
LHVSAPVFEPSAPVSASDCAPVSPPATAPENCTVEAALATALELAAKAGRFDVVATLAGELNARRLARANVAKIDEARRKRER